jgi:hypothetical protein
VFAQGSRFGGHALYVDNGRLKYVYNFLGELVQLVESDERIPTGLVVVSGSFDRQGTAIPAEGTLSLYIRDRKVGEGTTAPLPRSFRSRARLGRPRAYPGSCWVLHVRASGGSRP